jgi:hypothetical protein
MNALPRNDMSADAFLAKDKYTIPLIACFQSQEARSSHPKHAPALPRRLCAWDRAVRLETDASLSKYCIVHQ